ncbi:MAG: B12-binding domain-containing radical SAM protein [Acidobacteria bacterium]|nr:B12-binding domain-containing radical SAM protein [Acidobacteriota bacterium]
MKLVLINPRNPVSLYGDYLWQPLAFGYVAAVTPPHWTVELIDEQVEGTRDYGDVQADLVGLTAFTPQAPRAYAIAAKFRSRGIPVVMGGIHASLVQGEAARHADALFIGECEALWPTVIADVEAGRLQPVYNGGTRGESIVQPDRRIFEKYTYEYVSAQTSRGCPMDCSFCSVTVFNGRLFRMRTVDEVVAEVAAIPQRDIIFVDDDLNGFSRKAKQRCLDLFRAMADAKLGKQWITQVTINFGDDDELPALARAAGCAGVFIGLESTDKQSLTLIRKDGTSQRRGVDYYRENVARIRRHGVGVVGSFILGIDTQDMNTVAGDILRFAAETDLDGLNPTILTPLPGTRDYAKYDADGRILFKNYPQDWEKYTLAFPVTSMPNISGAGLMRKYIEVLQFFRPERIIERYWRTHDTVSPEAAWHTFLWNRVWTNYCLRNGAFRSSPLVDSYPAAIAHEVPARILSEVRS